MRKRYRFDEQIKKMVEVGEDWTDTPRKAPHLTEGVEYSNLRAPDGTPIDSRKKRREWMIATGSTDASDYSDAFFEKKNKERDRDMRSEGPGQREKRIEAIKRAFYEVNSRRK